VTSIGASSANLEVEVVGPPSGSGRLLRRILRRPVAVVSIIVILLIYLSGIFAPFVAPHGFKETDFRNRYASPSIEHPFGTDELGRDVLSRVIWSARTTVIISVATVFAGGIVIGVTAGLLSGYAGGRTDNLIMRCAEAFSSVPDILLLLIISATLTDRVRDGARSVEDWTGIDGIVESGAPEYVLVFVSLALFGWVGMARIIRSQVLALREGNYISAAQAMGASTPRILFRHLLPNVSNIIIVSLTLTLGAVAAAEVGLTFLGIGVHDPTPSYGIMISDYAGGIRQHPNLVLAPALVVAALVLAFNLLGDALTDVLSPRRR
jgi:ABC-type dipeptide/oligopeptide/nickel transport system permease subunit